MDEDLANFPARPVIGPVPARSTADFTSYEVRLSSLDSYRVFGCLSVPTGPGPFRGLLELPRHGSVNQQPHYNERLRYVVFTVSHRGQRLADSPFAAAYPGLFTLGIDTPSSYVYRAVRADTLFTLPSGQSPWSQDLLAALGDRLATYQNTDEDSTDMVELDAWLDAWLAGKLGVAPLRRFTAGAV